jgi:hypothetical protein
MTIVVDDNVVQIDRERIDVDDIASVKVRSGPQPINLWADALIAISVVVAGLAMSTPWLWPVSGVFGYMGYRANINAPLRRHRLVLRVAGAEAVAEDSTNEAQVLALKLQVQEAMARETGS